MPGIDPPTRTGGQDELEQKLATNTGKLGVWLGRGIYLLMAILVFMEFVLNPIFMVAQAQAEGVDISFDYTSFLWWVRIIMLLLVTFATSGVQWALLSPDRPKGGWGVKAGWTIAVADTAMDGGGFLNVWYSPSILDPFSFDQSNLGFGLFPPAGASLTDWTAYLLVCAVCLFNEPFLAIVLGRLTFDVNSNTLPLVAGVSIMTKKAGEHYNKIKGIAISFAPLNMIAMDLVLFPLSMAGETSTRVVIWSVFSVLVTIFGIALWEYFNHIRVVGGHAFKDLSTKLRLLGIGAIAVTVIDGYFDLVGFNEALFGQATALPPMEGLAALLTAALVMIMCTASEPMIGDIFAPLGAMGMLQSPGGGGPSGPPGSPGNPRPMPGRP
jgi:hypothetical protein